MVMTILVAWCTVSVTLGPLVGRHLARRAAAAPSS